MNENKIKTFLTKHKITLIALVLVVAIAWILGQVAVPVALKAIFL